jgi:hypothetical protein
MLIVLLLLLMLIMMILLLFFIRDNACGPTLHVEDSLHDLPMEQLSNLELSTIDRVLGVSRLSRGAMSRGK